MRNYENDRAEIERRDYNEMCRWKDSLGKIPQDTLVHFAVLGRLEGFSPIADNTARRLVMKWVRENKPEGFRELECVHEPMIHESFIRTIPDYGPSFKHFCKHCKKPIKAEKWVEG